MCGIAGIFDAIGHGPIAPRLITSMCDAIAHRGPDGEGTYFAPGLALGHRRLAIIDLSGGAQPMATDDGAVVIVFNGEIYNFADVTEILVARGHIFRTRSDTEAILHAWREWGPSCVEHLQGMFAFAVWDQRQESLFIARDRIGKKPLYYAIDRDRQLVFASEVKALRQWPGFDGTLDHQAVEDYFSLGYVPDPKSIYQQIRKLPPGHTLMWRRGGSPAITQYWDLDLCEGPSISMSDATDAFHSHFREAVGRRLISDVPLGAFLSGGVDSSAVVSTMARSMSDPVKTFTIGFGVADYDESAYARAVAQRYRTDHSETVIDPTDIAKDKGIFDRLVDIYDEPFGDNSAIPTLRVCAEARQRVTVALSGDGGDEAFAGYRRYLWHVREQRIRKIVPAMIRGPLFNALATMYPKLDSGPRIFRAKTTFYELSLDAVGAFFNSVSVIGDPLRRRLYTDRFRSQLQGYSATEVLREHMARCPDDSPLMQAQYADLKTWLAGRMLVKVDRASMANGLEVRSPFLDHDIFQWAARLPPHLKLSGSTYKAVVKKALEPFVSTDLLYRPKQGFTMPIGHWLRNDWRHVLTDALNSPALADSGLIEPRVVKQLSDEHLSGTRDHGPVLWNLLIFSRFLARHAPSGRVAA